MGLIKALVVDDEAPARSELRYLLEEAGGVEVIGEASNAQEAFQLIRAIPYDVVFLDIDMPGMSGMQLAEALGQAEHPPAVIFVTAHSEHAVKAFEVAATDYLVKPVELKRLQAAIARLRPTEEAPVRVERVPVEKAGRKLLIQVQDIYYVMAKDDYSYIFTASERFLSTMSLAQLESRLESQGFFRVHRRFLVNLAQVGEVVPMYGGTMLLTLKDTAATQVPASRRRVPALKKALGL
ncbi:LytTR family DNA-binding domain-containing protein [Coriobacteriia bacterium Es71-Z0120]|jgi:two-component system response regulator LytT|uniref:LytR/AlgR family response regulator transcription factor n=1 Tax=Parvivirga hydrogeniphila TaxID=2939460 RepID=UPI002260D1DD|nr:LytTR family DNA-binding domain-containing protein [Parvivirga hydrogeniphila]MCL4078345.1 LytTR family DNA-binding domain-containing protein [Parvivirga hydrogeniphila]